MLCSSLRHRGDELLAQNAGVAAYAERGKTMGIPLLYPWANRLAGFSYSVAGRTVEVPHDPTLIALDGNGLAIHGVIGGRQAWQVADAEGAGSDSLAARRAGIRSPRLRVHLLRADDRARQRAVQRDGSASACRRPVLPRMLRCACEVALARASAIFPIGRGGPLL